MLYPRILIVRIKVSIVTGFNDTFFDIETPYSHTDREVSQSLLTLAN